MRYIIVLFFIQISLYTHCQILDGYYEVYSEEGKILERLIISDNKFEQYSFEEDILNISTGEIKFSLDSISFFYDDKKPFRAYKIIYLPKKGKKNKLSVKFTLDLNNSSEKERSYRFLMHDSENREFDISQGFKTTKADTINVVDFVFESEGIIQKIKPFEDTSSHLIKIEFDDSKTRYCHKVSNAFEIINIDVNSIVLKIQDGMNLTYYRGQAKQADEFRKFLNMKNKIEYRY